MTKMNPDAELFDLMNEIKEYHDENTLEKVYRALNRAGLSQEEASDCVNELQNEGILFREMT